MHGPSLFLFVHMVEDLKTAYDHGGFVEEMCPGNTCKDVT